VSPKYPDALAVAPNGDLYLVDSGRDEILRRLPSDEFQVVAGNGREGRSGAAGLATRAALRLAGDSGPAIAENGTVYFADTGNDEVRAVLSDGQIETVAGGGSLSLPSAHGVTVPAHAAGLRDPTGLAIGPNHELCIASRFIVRLAADGLLYWVAGSSVANGALCATPGCPVGESILSRTRVVPRIPGMLQLCGLALSVIE
jgi:serine/threonine-protein kinase